MRRVILAAVSTVAALALLLSFKTHGTTSLASPPAVVVPSATPASVASAAAPATTTTKDKSRATTTTKTVTGDSVDTRYGPVQVAIAVTNGKLTAVNAIDYPQHDPRDEQINSYAIPQLDKEALAAGSAKIDGVSGATFTTDGYVSSLQSALDKAGL